MQVQRITAKNFRCFDSIVLDIEAPTVLMLGQNGSGKTSIMEALHYLCYLKSFRTNSPKDLIKFEQENFFLKVEFNDRDPVQVGFSGKQRNVKISSKSISSHKELLEHFCIITLIEDDLQIISGAPEVRRSLIDHQVLLHEPGKIKLYSDYRKILENRNSLIKSGSSSKDNYQLWTSRLLEVGNQIKELRKIQLKVLEEQIALLMKQYFKHDGISFKYIDKNGYFKGYQDFIEKRPELPQQERRLFRSLIGPHLDDFTISFNDKNAKTFASRGQKKLIALLIKTAQANYFSQNKKSLLFLLDDFLTDFDENKIKVSTEMLKNLNCQLFFSCPLENKAITSMMLSNSSQVINIKR